jgi:hypothetical protein
MLTISTVTVIAYIFRDTELVHNLLGIAPFADHGCTATFSATNFSLYNHGKIPILVGEQHAQNLWRIPMPARQIPENNPPIFEQGQVLLLNQSAQEPEGEHVRFEHAALGSPPPTTFLRAVARGFINGTRQFPHLTAKMVKRNMSNSEATARGHLKKTPTAQPYATSNAVSARQRHYKVELPQDLWRKKRADKTKPTPPPSDPTTIPKSSTLHLDYTGAALPERCTSGILYFMVSC